MQVGKATNSLLEKIQSFSGGRLARPADLGVLIEIAARDDKQRELHDLSFAAKFVTKAFGIMQRIGPAEEGYERLLNEFNENIRKVTDLVHSLIDTAGEDIKRNFTVEYLAPTHESFANLLLLLGDLGWLKNWNIDHKPPRNPEH